MNTSLYMDADKSIEVFNRDPYLAAFVDDQQLGFKEIPSIFRCHVIETKALKRI